MLGCSSVRTCLHRYSRSCHMIRIVSLVLLLLLVSNVTFAGEKGESEEGFIPIFDGKTLEGWTGATTGYAVEDGVLVCLKEKGGNLYTEKEYADFVLRFEFKLEENANNGLGIRAPLEGDA